MLISDTLTLDAPPPPSHYRERLARLALAMTHGVGPISFFSLLRKFDGAHQALEYLRSNKTSIEARKGIISSEDAFVHEKSIEGQGMSLLVYGDKDYPLSLRDLKDAPPLLYVKGNVTLLRRPCVSIVGARVASAFARRIAYDLSHDLSRAGFVVVSGLARGIDSCAHSAVLKGETIGVVANGLDCFYPQENTTLYRAMFKDGLVISEWPPGTKPQARFFLRRNRLISGLSRLVVVIEAGPKSGSLATARYALEQERILAVVPGSPADVRSRGGNDLLKNHKAHFVESTQDILKLLKDAAENLKGAHEHATQDSLRVLSHSHPYEGFNETLSSKARQGEKIDSKQEESTQTFLGTEGDIAPSRAMSQKEELTGDEKKILSLLSPDPVQYDALVHASHLPAGRVRGLVMQLLFKGFADVGPSGVSIKSFRDK